MAICKLSFVDVDFLSSFLQHNIILLHTSLLDNSEKANHHVHSNHNINIFVLGSACDLLIERVGGFVY